MDYALNQHIEYSEHKAPSIEVCRAEVSLVTCFWQLVARLQAQRIVSAIEVDEYFKAIV